MACVLTRGRLRCCPGVPGHCFAALSQAIVGFLGSFWAAFSCFDHQSCLMCRRSVSCSCCFLFRFSFLPGPALVVLPADCLTPTFVISGNLPEHLALRLLSACLLTGLRGEYRNGSAHCRRMLNESTQVVSAPGRSRKIPESSSLFSGSQASCGSLTRIYAGTGVARSEGTAAGRTPGSASVGLEGGDAGSSGPPPGEGSACDRCSGSERRIPFCTLSCRLHLNSLTTLRSAPRRWLR